MIKKVVDRIGKKFGRLTVISFSHCDSKSTTYWNCLCNCGTSKIVRESRIKSGGTKSCGCLKKELLRIAKTKHGMCGTPIYKSWQLMKQRCYNSKNTMYKRYGGRGIKVCKLWINSFENFYKDMGEKPKGKTIDRIDNNGDYKPSNCKWSTAKEQANNKSNSIHITVKGKTHTAIEWEQIRGLKAGKVSHRIGYGWSYEIAVLTP